MRAPSASTNGQSKTRKQDGGSGQAGLSNASVDDWSLRPRYTAADFITLLWRERLLIAVVFSVLFLLGSAFALTRPTTFPARSSLLVQVGQEYVYQPRAGDVARGETPEIDQVVQSEVEILTSAPLMARVVEQVGYARIFPDRARRYASASAERRQSMMRQAVASLGTAVKVETTPRSNVIRVDYRHRDPQVAAAVLNSLIENYLSYRREVLSDVTLPLVVQQRRAFEEKLSGAETAMENFLSANRIGDFAADKAALGTLQASIRDERYRVQARLQEVDGRLTALSRQVPPSQINLYRDVDMTAENRLRDLRLQREELLSRYQPGARPVHELDVQITQLERMLRDGRGSNEGARREGLNPIYQAVETERIQLRAERASLVSRRGALDAQLGEITERRLELTRLEPEFQNLTRQRAALENNLRTYLAREQEQQAANAIATEASDNIRVVQRATPAARGASLKGEALIVSFLLALATAFAVALARIFLRRSFFTASSAGRTLDLPVLSTAPLKPANA
jgi:uncharacterized protein involved in exopolysaccharide biosynthesis